MISIDKILAFLLLSVVSILLCLEYGASDLRFSQLLVDGNVFHSAVLQLRWNRVAVCFLSGGLLAVAGCLSQSLFQNFLATPTVIGTAAGASFGAILTYFLTSTSTIAIVVGSSLGSMTAMILLFAISWRYSKNSFFIHQLLLTGLALNIIFSALSMMGVSVLMAGEIQTPDILYWLYGDANAKGTAEIITGMVIAGILLLTIFFQHKNMDRLQLGKELAHNLGVPVDKIILLVLLLISLAVGGNMYMTGFMPFIGLVVPLSIRGFCGNHTLPLSFLSLLMGGTLAILADLICRTVFGELGVQLGAITALIGAPIFLLILLKNQARFGFSS